jgi:hypothetical protein
MYVSLDATGPVGRRRARSRTRTTRGGPAGEARVASGPPTPTALAEEVLLRVACTKDCQCAENTMEYYRIHIYIHNTSTWESDNRLGACSTPEPENVQ